MHVLDRKADFRQAYEPTHEGMTADGPIEYEQGVRLPDPTPIPESPTTEWRAVPMPPGVYDLPRDFRGFPVFYTILPEEMPEDGRVDFRFVRTDRFTECVLKQRCGVCGRALRRNIWFIGGPRSLVNRLFGDPGMHEHCARYAMRVCPHLTRPNHQYAKMRGVPDPPGVVPDPGNVMEHPERTVLYQCQRYQAITQPGVRPLIAVEPARAVEWYQPDGTYIARTRPTRYYQ